MAQPLAVIFIDAFADWEVGFLTSALRDWFETDVKYFTPNGESVTSEGGLRIIADGKIADIDPNTFAAVAVAGSSRWAGDDAPDISSLLQAMVAANKVVGVICAATLAAARAGLFSDRKHTSNDAKWLNEKVPNYAGASNYQAVKGAVADKNVVSAPGSAPASFALAMVSLLFPSHPALAQTREILTNSR